MRRIVLSIFLILFSLLTISNAQTVNSANLLKQLLDLPAPAPPSELIAQSPPSKFTQREPEFYAKNQIPSDDAPIQDLLDYWAIQSQSYRELGYNVKPSEKTVARILEFCEDNHDVLPMFLNIIPAKPEFAEVVKRIYDEETKEPEKYDYNWNRARMWLVYRSAYYIDELLKKARKVQDKDEYVTNQDELLALTRVDWEKARPILEKLVDDKNQPVSSTLAKWAYYVHAIETGDERDIEKYRRLLQETVEDRSYLPGARDLAMDALAKEQGWDGRDDWYISLLSDETLFDLKVNGRSFTGLTTILLYSPPEKWIPAMIKLVGNKNPAVHRAAVRNLSTYLDEENVEVIRALLPWLSNPKWADEVQGERQKLIVAVGKVDLPESIPNLIAILTNEEEYRSVAAQSLAKYKDARAVPALKLVLANEESPNIRSTLIAALIECGGLNDDEQVQALEAYATMISTPDGLKQYQSYEYGSYEEEESDGEEENVKPRKPLPLILSIGKYVSEIDEPTDGLVSRAIARVKALRKTKPAVANTLDEIMRKWKGRVIFIEKLRQIRSGEADVDTILMVLAKRKEIREKVLNEVFALGGASGMARGIGACLTEEQSDFLSILSQRDAETQTAMFACARLLRAQLPVAEVGAFLTNPNKTLALSAERYLESVDSVQARRLVLARHPNEALILGARLAFIPEGKNASSTEALNELFQSVNGRIFYNSSYAALDTNEEKLRKEIKENQDLAAIYAILPNKAAGQQVVRVFKDKITFTNYEDEARYRERTLTAKEYEDFYRFLLAEKIDVFIPFNTCYGCPSTEFVMFGRDGGRRVFFPDGMAGFPPIKNLFEKFEAFNRGELRLRYFLADKIKGLEVLSADNKFIARAVWKNGGDLRVLVEDTDKKAEIMQDLAEKEKAENAVEIEEDDYKLRQERYQSQYKRREDSKYDHFVWRNIENGKLGGITAQPLEAQYLIDETQFPENAGFDSTRRAWQVRAGMYEIRTTQNEENPGIFKVSRSQTPVKIKDGLYFNPIVTPDGNWAVVSKVEKSWEEPNGAARINLQTGKEFKINLPFADQFAPIAYIASQNKMLLYRAKAKRYSYEGDVVSEEEETPPDPNDKNPSPKTPEYYLLDVNTGATQLVKGEFRPLENQTYRPLQAAASAPNEFWAAIYDEKLKETAVGRYNTKTFTFQPVTKLPGINLDSMDIWADEKEAKIYFVYQGHLLSAPLVNQ